MAEPAKTIVFDWNGTLFDDAPIACRCNSLVSESLGYPPIAMDAFRQYWSMPIENLYRGLGVSEADIQTINASLLHLFHDNYEPLADKTPLREGAADFLGRAHAADLRQIILSNHIIGPIDRQLNRLGVASFIAAILANPSREHQFRGELKSERLHNYMRQNNLAPEWTVIVGDSPEETHIARSLGLISVAMTGGFVSEQRLSEARPDHLVHSFSELMIVLREQGFIP